MPLTARGIVLVHRRCCRVKLAYISMFGSGIGVGNGTRCTICMGSPFILPLSAGLGIIPRTDGVGSNRPRDDHNSSRDSLLQVDLAAKRLQDC